MIELQERFDRAWAGEPEHPPVDQRLADGQRRLRRRRLAVAGGLLGAVVALGGTGIATGLIPDPADRTPVAGGATPVDPGEPSGAKGVEIAQTVADLDRIDEDHNAAYTEDGRVIIRPGWQVSARLDDTALGDAQKAVGLEITNTDSGEQEWYSLRWWKDGTASVNRSWPKANLGMTFREWLPDVNGVRSRG